MGEGVTWAVLAGPKGTLRGGVGPRMSYFGERVIAGEEDPEWPYDYASGAVGIGSRHRWT